MGDRCHMSVYAPVSAMAALEEDGFDFDHIGIHTLWGIPFRAALFTCDERNYAAPPNLPPHIPFIALHDPGCAYPGGIQLAVDNIAGEIDTVEGTPVVPLLLDPTASTAPNNTLPISPSTLRQSLSFISLLRRAIEAIDKESLQ